MTEYTDLVSKTGNLVIAAAQKYIKDRKCYKNKSNVSIQYNYKIEK